MTPAAPSRRTDRANRVGHLEAIHQLTAAMVTSTTVESIHGAALDVLVASLSADRAAILLFDRDGIIRFKAWRGLSDGYRQAASGHSPWRPDEADPEAIVVADAATDESLGALRGTVLAEGIRSLAFIPLLYGTRLLGKFMLYAAEPGQFGPDELALARTVAAHVAFALEKRRLEDELRLSADKLAATLNAVSEGITVQAPDGRLILANEAAAAMVGFPSVPALLAASPAEIMTAFETFDANGQVLSVERLPGRAALRGQEPEEMLVRSRLAATGVERISVVKARAVRDEAGEVRFAVNVFRDVTDRELAVEALRTSEARLAFLASASRRLLTTDLEPRKVLEEVADLVVPELADWCIVREFDDDGRLVRVAVRPPRDEQNEIETQLERYGDLLPEHPAVQDLIKGRSILVNDITMAILEQLARDDEHLELLTQLGLRSVMLVPLRTRGRTTGVLTLAGGRDRPAYTDSDLALAEEFAGRVSATVDNARSFAVEHSTPRRSPARCSRAACPTSPASSWRPATGPRVRLEATSTTVFRWATAPGCLRSATCAAGASMPPA